MIRWKNHSYNEVYDMVIFCVGVLVSHSNYFNKNWLMRPEGTAPLNLSSYLTFSLKFLTGLISLILFRTCSITYVIIVDFGRCLLVLFSSVIKPAVWIRKMIRQGIWYCRSQITKSFLWQCAASMTKIVHSLCLICT